METQSVRHAADVLALPWRGETIRLACFLRHVPRAPWLVYVHGLGSTGADFSCALDAERLRMWSILLPDLPACGGSSEPSNGTGTIDDLAELMLSALDAAGVERACIIGHSLGGLIALRAATRSARAGGRIRAFVNIEGNLAPEDCFWSRSTEHIAGEELPGQFLADFMAEQAASGRPGFGVWAARFPRVIGPRAFLAYTRAIVHESDTAPLLEEYLALPMPTLFVHGAANAALPYLTELSSRRRAVAAIPGSDHFPFHSNPAALLETISAFLEGAWR